MCPGRAAQLLEVLEGREAGECSICMDAPVHPVVTDCAHGPFCRECMAAVLQHQVRPPLPVHHAPISHPPPSPGCLPAHGGMEEVLQQAGTCIHCPHM